MSAEAEPTFAGDFPPATEEQWLALVDKVLEGAPLSKLRSTTPGGVPVEPLYTRAGSPGDRDEAGFPGAAPFVRGSAAVPDDAAGWQRRSVVTAADPHDANRLALRELERGATELTLRFDAAFRAGVAPADDGFSAVAGVDGVLVTSTADLDAVLEDVLLDVAPVHLQPGARFARAAELLATVWERRGLDPATLVGGLGADPIGVLADQGRLPQGIDGALAELSALAARFAKLAPGVRTVSVDTAPYVEAGASEIQELAVALATGAAYLREMSDSDLDADQACASIELRLSADADVFTTIAKLRAARRVWAAMTAACGASPAAQAPQLHVRTAQRMMTRRDPWVNLLRVTAAGFAAGVGGAASVTTAAFDSALGEPDELGRRLARNTQLLLQAESNVGRVLDPAGGSWYVESLTDEIAEAAWGLFGRLEANGGLPAVLFDGSLRDEIAQVRDARLARVATRRDPITGVSEFADVAEPEVQRAERDLRTLRSRAVNVDASGASTPSGTPTECTPMPRVRWAQDFEELRDASDAYLAATGSRPTIFLANLGPVAEHTARATFATNLYAAGGIVATTSERGVSTGFDGPTGVVEDATAAGAHLVCVCGSDDRYAVDAVAVVSALRDAGIGPVHLAGNPGDRRDAETAAGVAEFIHVGVDVLDVLRRTHATVGTPYDGPAPTRTTK